MLSLPPASFAASMSRIAGSSSGGVAGVSRRSRSGSWTRPCSPSEQRKATSPVHQALLDDVHVERVLGPDGLGDHVAQRVAVDLVRRQDALRPGGGDPGVVARELGELAAAHQVAAAVADRADRERAAVHQRGHGGGAHAGVVLAVVRGLEHPLVGQADGGLEPVGLEGELLLQAVGPGDVLLLAVALADERGQRLDGDARGHLARVVAAHAVAHGEEVRRPCRPGSCLR